MRTKTKLGLVQFVGLALRAVIGFIAIAGAATYDGGLIGAALTVIVPLGLYGAGLFLVLRGLTKQLAEQQQSPT